MKQILALFLASVICLFLVACGGGSGTTETNEEQTTIKTEFEDTIITTEEPVETIIGTIATKEELMSVAVPMTQELVEQITEKKTGKDFAKTLISNTYTFTGKVYAKEENYVGVGIYVLKEDGKLLGYDYQSTLSFYVYLPAEEFENVRYDDTITIVGKITDVFREERKDAMFTDMVFPVTVIVMEEAHVTE